MYRKTYAKIDHNVLTTNIKEIKEKYPDYQYYIGVVKNNAYHHGIKIVNALKEGGINYFAVSSLEEALNLRKYNMDTPILILEPIDLDYVYDCIHNNLAITIEALEDIKVLDKMKFSYPLKIHLKLDTGMNRLGFKNQKHVEQAKKIISENAKLELEGIYSHFATSGITDKEWDNQLEQFLELTKNINLKEIPIVHFGRSLTLVNHKKIDFCNGIRLGIIMYGFSQSKKHPTTFKEKLRESKKHHIQKKLHISETMTENELNLNTAFSLYSTVMSIRKVKKDELIGYNASYKVEEDGYLATIPIGYADGVDKSFETVKIKNNNFPIVADSMDMISVLVDKSIQKGMEVEIFGNQILISEITQKLNTNAYHLFNQIQNRVPRIHITNGEEEEINY